MLQEKTRFMNANDVMKALGVSESKAYKIIRELNEQMKAKGYYTIHGRISARYFAKCFYGFDE